MNAIDSYSFQKKYDAYSSDFPILDPNMILTYDHTNIGKVDPNVVKDIVDAYSGIWRLSPLYLKSCGGVTF